MSPLPNMVGALPGFSTPAQFLKIAKTVVNYESVETEGEASTFGGGGMGVGPFDTPGNLSGIFSGVFVPIPPHKLMVKPEGQRNWKWWTLTTTKALSLDDLIIDRALTRYRVMSSQDWSSAGFYVYELTEDRTQ